jgi:pSer/pThr/pTyr-binding forkhead associated (FHA) protein
MDDRPSDANSDQHFRASEAERDQAYRLFTELYDNHRDLFDEIIQLEQGGESVAWPRMTTKYVQGVMRGQQAYLITNLLNGKTQSLLQHQKIWTIGRDSHAALPIQDQRLSRRHAAIHYAERIGFFLVDLDSTNGSYVNGQPVHGQRRLRDGDRVRLGGFAFSFFVCYSSQMVNAVPPEVLNQIQALPVPEDSEISIATRLGVADALAVPRAQGEPGEPTLIHASDQPSTPSLDQRAGG